MAFLIICALSALVYTGMSVGLVSKIFKDFADCGYKINVDKVNNIVSGVKGNEVNNVMTDFIKFIPVVNVFYATYLLFLYQTNKDKIFSEIDVMGGVERLSDEELTEYNKKRTGLHAIYVTSKFDVDIENALVYEYKDDFGSGKIYYVFEKEDESITIIKSEGRCSLFSLEEKERIIRNYFNELKKTISKKYNEKITVVLDDVIDEDKELVFEEKSEFIESFEKLSNEQKIELLKYIRYFILKDELERRKEEEKEDKKITKKK